MAWHMRRRRHDVLTPDASEWLVEMTSDAVAHVRVALLVARVEGVAHYLWRATFGRCIVLVAPSEKAAVDLVANAAALVMRTEVARARRIMGRAA
jgi:hypothetical protein